MDRIDLTDRIEFMTGLELMNSLGLADRNVYDMGIHQCPPEKQRAKAYRTGA